MALPESKLVAPQRRPSASANGSGAVDRHTQELMDHMTAMFDQHVDKRREIDALLSRLRDSEGDAHAASLEDADQRASLTVRRHEADHTLQVQEKKVAGLEKELEMLEALRTEKGRNLQKLEADLQGAQARLKQSGAASHDAEALLRQLQGLEERERHLRTLEHRLVSCEDLRVEGSQTLTALLREHEELGLEQGDFYQGVHGQMHNNQTVADTLSAQLRDLTERRQQLVEERHEGVEAARAREEHYQELVDVKGVLEQDLRRAQNSLQRQEQELHAYMDELLGPYAQPDRLGAKLEETMMLLKAAAISLDADFCFVGEINDKASTIPPSEVSLPDPQDPAYDEVLDEVTATYRGLQSFCDAYRFILGQVEALHGAQQEGERWVLRGAEVPFEGVEPLLSALKQLVTCYDMVCQWEIFTFCFFCIFLYILSYTDE